MGRCLLTGVCGPTAPPKESLCLTTFAGHGTRACFAPHRPRRRTWRIRHRTFAPQRQAAATLHDVNTRFFPGPVRPVRHPQVQAVTLAGSSLTKNEAQSVDDWAEDPMQLQMPFLAPAVMLQHLLATRKASDIGVNVLNLLVEQDPTLWRQVPRSHPAWSDDDFVLSVVMNDAQAAARIPRDAVRKMDPDAIFEVSRARPDLLGSLPAALREQWLSTAIEADPKTVRFAARLGDLDDVATHALRACCEYIEHDFLEAAPGWLKPRLFAAVARRAPVGYVDRLPDVLSSTDPETLAPLIVDRPGIFAQLAPGVRTDPRIQVLVASIGAGSCPPELLQDLDVVTWVACATVRVFHIVPPDVRRLILDDWDRVTAILHQNAEMLSILDNITPGQITGALNTHGLRSARFLPERCFRDDPQLLPDLLMRLQTKDDVEASGLLLRERGLVRRLIEMAVFQSDRATAVAVAQSLPDAAAVAWWSILIDRYADSYAEVPAHLKGHPDLVEVAIRRGGPAFGGLPESVRRDPDVVRAALKANFASVRFVPVDVLAARRHPLRDPSCRLRRR